MTINLIPVAKIVFILQTTKGKSIYSTFSHYFYTTYSIIERNLYRTERKQARPQGKKK